MDISEILLLLSRVLARCTGTKHHTRRFACLSKRASVLLETAEDSKYSNILIMPVKKSIEEYLTNALLFTEKYLDGTSLKKFEGDNEFRKYFSEVEKFPPEFVNAVELSEHEELKSKIKLLDEEADRSLFEKDEEEWKLLCRLEEIRNRIMAKNDENLQKIMTEIDELVNEILLNYQVEHEEEQRNRIILFTEKVEKFDDILISEYAKDEEEIPSFASDTRIAPGDVPEYYVQRDKLLRATKRKIRANGFHVVTALKGMGGVGKTLLARSVSLDDDVMNTFEGGVYWIDVGAKMDSLTLLRNILSNLGDEVTEELVNITEGRAILKRVLSRRGFVLLILDDVWRVEQVNFLRGISRECSLLVTTRSLEAARWCEKEPLCVDLMEQREGQAMLRKLFSLSKDEELPEGATEFLKRSGGHPMAISIGGSMVSVGNWTFQELVKVLDEKNISVMSYDESLECVFEVSLGTFKENEQKAYDDLLVFPPDVEIPEELLELYLSPHFEGNHEKVRNFSRTLLHRGLFYEERDHEKGHMYVIHDLHLSFVKRRGREKNVCGICHERLVKVVEEMCDGKWEDLPDNGYIWERLLHHMIWARETMKDRGRDELLLNPVWMRKKIICCGLSSLQLDVKEWTIRVGPDETLDRVYEALRLSGYILRERPEELEMQVCGRLIDNDNKGVADFVERCKDILREREVEVVPLGPFLQDSQFGPLLRVLDHTSPVECVCLTNDGKLVISGTVVGVVRVWDMETGVKYHSLRGHQSAIEALVVTKDKKYIISGCSDGEIRIWEMENWNCVHSLCGHNSAVEYLHILKDDKRFVSASLDGTIRVWKIDSGKQLYIFGREFPVVRHPGITDDEKLIIYGCSNGEIHVNDLETGREINSFTFRKTMLQWDRVRRICVTRDGKYVISASSDGYMGIMRVWNLEDGSEKCTLRGHTAAIESSYVTIDGKYVVSGSGDRTVRVWCIETGEEIHSLLGPTNVVCVRGASRRIVSGFADGTVLVWDRMTGEQQLILRGHFSGIQCLAVTKDGSRSVSGSEDGTVRVWDTSINMYEAQRTLSGHFSGVKCIHVTRDGRRAITGSWDGSVRVWDMETGKEQHILCDSSTEHHHSVLCVSVTDDGRRAVTGSGDGSVHVWNMDGGEAERVFKGSSFRVKGVYISQDGTRIVSGSEDGTVRVWDMETGNLLRSFRPDSSGLWRVRVMSDGALAATALYNGSVVVWDMETGHEQKVVFTSNSGIVRLRCFSASRDERMLASGWEDGTIRVWNMETGEERLSIKGHVTGVAGIRILGNGRIIISGSTGGTVRVWEMSDHSARCLRSIGIGQPVTCCALSKCRLVVGTSVGSVHFFSVATPEM